MENPIKLGDLGGTTIFGTRICFPEVFSLLFDTEYAIWGT